MNDSDLPPRLDALISALAPAGAAPAATGDEADRAAGADAQRMATAQIDDLLRRVSVLTAALGVNDGLEWDDVDQLAAQLLMADLSAISSATRALNALSDSRLSGALADLRAAGVDVERVVKEASGS